MKERPDFDQEKEWQRWKGFFSVWTAPEPEVGQTPRIAVWKKTALSMNMLFWTCCSVSLDPALVAICVQLAERPADDGR